MGIVNVILTCIIVVFVTVGIVIITSRSPRQVTTALFTVSPVVACLTSILLDVITFVIQILDLFRMKSIFLGIDCDLFIQIMVFDHETCQFTKTFKSLVLLVDEFKLASVSRSALA